MKAKKSDMFPMTGFTIKLHFTPQIDQELHKLGPQEVDTNSV